jgi:hypothetical protein
MGPNTANRLLRLVTVLWLGGYEPPPPPPPIHSPYLALRVFYFFGPLNMQLGSKQIAPVADMKQAVTSRLQTLNS